MPDVLSLTAEVERLTAAVSWWNTAILVMMVVAAFAAAGLVVTQRIAFGRAEELTNATGRLSDLKERLASQKLADTNERAGKLEKGAADANVTVATLQLQASEAKAAQQLVETDLAKQRERTAIAERALLDLQNRIKPRRLTDKEAADFVRALNAMPGETVEFATTIAGGDEAANFAKQLIPLFKEAHWTVKNEAKIDVILDIQVIGVGILVSGPEGFDPSAPVPGGGVSLPRTPTITALQSAFGAVKMAALLYAWFPHRTLEVVIGSKPDQKP